MVNYEEETGTGRTFTQHYEYTEFDEKGNWTTRIGFPGADKIRAEWVVKRKIEYY